MTQAVPAFRYEPDLIFTVQSFIQGALVAMERSWSNVSLRGHLPAALTALAVLIYLVLITGAFHEDGLADTADALSGG